MLLGCTSLLHSSPSHSWYADRQQGWGPAGRRLSTLPVSAQGDTTRLPPLALVEEVLVQHEPIS